MSNLLQKQPPEMFYKKAFLKNFAIFTGKRLCSGEYCEIFKNFCFEETSTSGC